jgi:hypothetical protein
VLTYVIWHTPESVDGIASYEAALTALDRSLRPAAIRGFRGSRTLLVQGVECMTSGDEIQ